MNYKISVIMPVYNEQNYLRASIESILNQTFTDFEFIIIDDGSTDNSASIVEAFKDDRIRFYKSKKKGIVKQLNYGISLAKAQIIARMDADDIAERNRFEEQFNYLKHNPAVHVVGSNVFFVNDKGKVICEKTYPENHEDIEFMMPVESALCHPSVMMRKKIFDCVGLYKDNYSNAEDYELFLNLLLKGYRFYNIQKVLLRYLAPVLRKDVKRTSNSNDPSYQLGINYLENIHKGKSVKDDDYNYYYRIALTEYYKGSVVRSRGFFLKCLGISKKHFFRIIRFLLISLFGDSLIKHLRKIKVLPLLSLYLNRYLKIDLHSIKR